MQYSLLHSSPLYGFGELEFTYMSVSWRRAKTLIIPGPVTHAERRLHHCLFPELPLIVCIMATG